jgi:hypothetical protein
VQTPSSRQLIFWTGDGGGGGHPYRLAAYRQPSKPDCWRPEAKVHW